MNSFIITRPQLHKKLQAGLERKLTLVIAPAGCGKSTSVFEWLHAGSIPSSWLSLDANDNNPLIFWRYLYASLGSVLPANSLDRDFLSSSRELLETQVKINTLVNELAEIEEDFAVVLDNFQLIDHPEIIRALDHLIEYMPARMHLFILSRHTPQITILRKEFSSQVLRLGFRQLQFDAQEVAEFYRIRGLVLDPRVARQVETHTSGWPAALVAIAMAMENEEEPISAMASISHCQRGIEEYLLEEVVAAYSPEKRDFLYQISILDCLCMDLCFAVTGNPDSETILQEMNERNEFILAFDQDLCKYRFNPIFKEFLFKELNKTRPEILPELYEKAARWSEQAGLPLRAITYYIYSEDLARAVQLMEDQLGNLVAGNEYETGKSILEKLPVEIREQNLRIACFYAFDHAEQNRCDEALDWVERAGRLLEEIAEAEVRAMANTLVTITRAYVLLRMGRLAEFTRLLSGLEPNAQVFARIDRTFDFNRSDIYFYRCPIHKVACLAGEKPKVFERINEIYGRITQKTSGYPELALGEYLYEKNRTAEALPHLLRAAEQGSAEESPGLVVPALIDIARIKRARREPAGLAQVLEECGRKLEPIHRIHWDFLLEAFQMRHRLEIGELTAVTDWIRVRKLAVFNEISVLTEFELLVFARALLAMDKLEDADLLLLRLLTFTQTAGRNHSMVEVLCLQADLFHRKAEYQQAAESLEKALATGLEEGYFRSFVDEGESLADVLKTLLADLRKRDEADGALAEYAKTILHQIHQEARGAHVFAARDPRANIRSLLTPKELEVLELVAAACSNEEIGSKLQIKLRTVKTHTANIYGKLGVANRSQCLKLIHELQMYHSGDQSPP